MASSVSLLLFFSFFFFFLQRRNTSKAQIRSLKEKFGRFVDFEFLTEKGFGEPTNRIPLVEKNPPRESG